VYLRSGAPQPGSSGKIYEEEIIILDFGEQPRVFYKFAVGAGFGPGGHSFGRGGPEEARHPLLAPAIAYWVLKKAAMAGAGVAVHVGATLAFEKWFGEYDTWGQAWDNSSFTAWELVYAGVSGVLSDRYMVQFLAEVGNSMVS
ncbi:hypothetical protein RZS08_30440, partial [Arthrospira platensis SPKY1]|nr:hypothetical protein [Arthrospira platensis SPKY1]